MAKFVDAGDLFKQIPQAQLCRMFNVPASTVQQWKKRNQIPWLAWRLVQVAYDAKRLKEENETLRQYIALLSTKPAPELGLSAEMLEAALRQKGLK